LRNIEIIMYYAPLAKEVLVYLNFIVRNVVMD